MRSLQARLLLSGSVLLTMLLFLTGVVLESAFRDAARTAVDERLQAYIYGLLGVADIDEGGHLVLPDALPDTRFSSYGSGLYAGVLAASGETLVWQSPSLNDPALRPQQIPAIGQWWFGKRRNRLGDKLFVQAFTVVWEVAPDEDQEYTLFVAESAQRYKEQVREFRRSLWIGFCGMALVLLFGQWLVLHWGLGPLRQLTREVASVEQGRQADISGDFPPELQRLALNLNRLLDSSARQLQRYRNALGDLAHSLKTPLAVIRATVDGQSADPQSAQELETQLQRADQAIEYHLQRAAVSGRRSMLQPVPLRVAADQLARALEKVYAHSSLAIENCIDEQMQIQIDAGDLTELLGNLLDNACKWSRGRVRLSARATGNGFVLEIEDDGPGFEPDELERLLQRGVSGSPLVPGHGIGLSVVRDLIETVYHGHLQIGCSEELGGARVSLCFPED